MRKVLRWIRGHKRLTLVFFVVLVVGLFFVRSRSENGKLEESSVARGDVTEEMILSGLITADEHAQLSFPISGKISWINVSEGQEVTKGQVLAKLDSVSLNAAMARAGADLRASEASRAAIYDSLQNKDTSETFAERDTRTAVEVAYDKAYEAFLIAQDNLRSSILVAPFAGIITFVANPFTGVNIMAAQNQIEIVNPDTIHFLVLADQSEVVEVSVGEKVEIVLDANDEALNGTVVHVSFTTIPGEVGTVYSIKVRFDDSLNNDFTYRIGMTGDAHFVLAQKENVLYVPSGFVKSDAGGDYVLINEGKDKTYIGIGLEGEERTEVVSGINEGVLIYD